MLKGRKQSILMLVAVAVLIFLLFNLNSKSSYTITEREYAPFGVGPVAPGPSAGVSTAGSNGMNKGSGLASSLLPREIASQEDFGQFAPSDVLAGQNFLDPQQIRKDPPNPKTPFVWNNSTIVPDLMQRGLCA